MNPLRFTRRNLLRGGIAATAAIPLLEARMARGQTATYPTRLIVMATPNGTRNSLFWPTGTETNFNLNTFTPDLAPYKSKLTFLKGAQLEDPTRLFNSSLDGNARRAIDLREGEQLDEAAFKELIRAAVTLNESAAR